MLQVLNFPSYQVRITADQSGQSSKIFDIVRRKFVSLTPEEWVRQHLLNFVVTKKNFPKSLISVEKSVKVNGLPRRTDVLIYTAGMKKILLAECKAPSVKITQKVFDQAARYNLSLNVKFFVLTNGMETFCCVLDHVNKKYTFLKEIPEFSELDS